MLEEIAKQLKRIANLLEQLENEKYCKMIPIVMNESESTNE